jgi:ubiquinone/menaquinone biosynthesis C-methylase UbiE
MTREVAYWNNDAADYDHRSKKSYTAYQKIINLIKKDITNEMNILDIGTGTGEIPINICDNVKNIEAIDFSTKMIQIAKNKSEKRGIKNIKCQVQDSNNLNYKNDSFDVIIIMNLLHIVPNPENVLNEAKRLIKNKGKIIIATYLHNQNIKSRLISYIMKKKGHPIVTKFNCNTIFDFIEICNLKIISKEYIPNLMPLFYLTATKI